MVSEKDLVRGTEFMEKCLLYNERNGLYKSINICVKLNHGISESLASHALRKLILQYPLLFSTIQGSEPNIKYEPLQQVLLEDVFFINTGPSTHLSTSSSFRDHYLTKKPLWRVVFHAQSNLLSFISSHAFTDGGSVVAYLKDLVEFFNRVEASYTVHELFNLQKDLPTLKRGIPPGYLTFIDFKPSYVNSITSFMVRFFASRWAGFVPNVIDKQRHGSGFEGLPVIPFDNKTFFESEYIVNEDSPLNKSKAFILNIPSDTLTDIIASCRAHNVKFLTTFVIAYIATIHQLYPGLYSEKYLKIGFAGSFRNTRDDMKKHSSYRSNPKDSMEDVFEDGFYTFGAFYNLEPFSSFNWDLVKKYNNRIHKQVNSQEWVVEYYMASNSLTAENFMSPMHNKKKDDTFLVSTNLGHIDFIDYGPDSNKYQIEDILFAPSAGALMGTHSTTLCSSTKGGLNIGLVDSDNNIKDWSLFKDKLAENLKKLTQD